MENGAFAPKSAFSQVCSAYRLVKIIIGKLSTLRMFAILKISVCRISMPQLPSLIGCMDIIYAHDAHLNC